MALACEYFKEPVCAFLSRLTQRREILGKDEDNPACDECRRFGRARFAVRHLYRHTDFSKTHIIDAVHQATGKGPSYLQMFWKSCEHLPRPHITGYPRRPMPNPTLAEKFRMFITAGSKWWRRGMKLVTFEEWTSRLDICASCADSIVCPICGCSKHAKAAMPTERCPEGKWETIRSKTARKNTFITPDKMPSGLEGMFWGQKCFLICNGPSFASIDKYPLHHRLTMTMNNGGANFRSTLWTGQDPPDKFSHVIWEDPTIMKFTSIGNRKKRYRVGHDMHESKKAIRDCPNIWFHRLSDQFEAHKWLADDKIVWGLGHEEGRRSVFLSALHILWHLGVEEIYLVGADFEMAEDQCYWFDESHTGQGVRQNNHLFGELIKYLTELIPYLDAAGQRIYNCNPDSKLTVFPYLPYNEALDRTTLSPQYGTRGMYARPWTRVKETTADALR